MSFTPEGYKVPKTPSQFMSFELGDNKVRVLSDAVIGWEGWKGGKPFRHEGDVCKITVDQVDTDPKYGKPKINHFWAFIVWNYADQKIQVLEITQKTIMNKIHNYDQDVDYGHPKGYDLTIIKSKNGDKTEYDVIAKPPKPVDVEILKKFEETDVKLDALFKGEYPVDEE